MRYVHLLLCLLMLLFTAVQYNDPDGALWMAFYLMPAAWTAIAAGRPRWLERRPVRVLLLASLAVMIICMIRLWPATPHWWAQAVWYETETAREGMGVMIAAGILLLVTLSTGRRRTVSLPDEVTE